MRDSNQVSDVSRRDSDALGLVQRALCLIESGGSGSTAYAEHLRLALTAAANAGIIPTHARARP